MQLLTILISVALAQSWGSRNPLHRDAWFQSWCAVAERLSGSAAPQGLTLLLILAGPLILLLLMMAVIASVSYWLLMPIGIVVLLYSFGRQSMEDAVDPYTSAFSCENWAFGVKQAAELQVDTSAVDDSDWNSLHQQVLRAASYRGFERFFAVLFWFVVLGPIGALLYRLSWLHASNRGEVSARWLWLLEWPVVRLLGVSFAVTGNFVGCMRQWRECFFCGTRSSSDVLVQAVTGALSVSSELQAQPCVSRHELVTLQALFRRTLWLWLGGLGLWTLFV